MPGQLASQDPDLYTNFFSIISAFNASNSTTLTEESASTGMSVRGGFIWLVHKVEFFMDEVHQINADNDLKAVLSTVPGQTVIPPLTRKGTLARVQVEWILSTSGGGAIQQPFVVDFALPVPIASRRLVLYAETADDSSPLHSAAVEARVHYNTIPATAQAYTEVAEVWGNQE